ncbi:MAG: glycosyl hydrolase [Bacteroidota bacterium]|nr:glycosyl hydrolase [Bacteroidota bacterium]
MTVLPLTEGQFWKNYNGKYLPEISPATSPQFLSDEYFERYKYILDYSKENNRNVVLYDDIDFPSGTAGGLMGKKYPQYTWKELKKSEINVEGPVSLTNAPVDWTDDYQGTVAMNMESLQRIDLTGNVRDGKISWDVPEGNWKIMTFYIKSNVDQNLNFMDPNAIKTFMSLTYDKYTEHLGSYFGETINRIFFDDIGYYGCLKLWDKQIPVVFEAQTGKKAVLYYPALWYNIGGETQAARIAMFRIRAKLVANYPKYITQWCSAHGLSAMGHSCGNYEPNTNDMYGDPFEFYQYQQIPLLDIIHGYPYGRPGFKLISSAADLYGREVVGAEIYGNYSNQEVDSLMLYRIAMEAMALGVNYFVPHGMWLTPDKMKITPLIMHENDKLAPSFPEYNAFMGRSCWLLNGGKRVADIAVLFPIESLQAWSNFALSEIDLKKAKDGKLPDGSDVNKIINALKPGKNVPDGNDYNKISDLLTNQVRQDFTFIHPQRFTTDIYTINKGIIRMNAAKTGQEYKLLILPASKVISVATLKKIYDFYLSGGKIIATHELPYKSAEFGCDSEVKKLIAEMFGSDSAHFVTSFKRKNQKGGKIIFLPEATSESLKLAINEMLPDADVKIEDVKALIKPDSDKLLGVDKYRDLPSDELGVLSYIHKKKNGRDIFMFANSTNIPVTTQVRLKGKLRLEKYNPYNGHTMDWNATYLKDKEGTDYTVISLSLNAITSVFAVSK